MNSTTNAFNGYTLSSAFQPIYCARDKRTYGFEALLRALAPAGGDVRPGELFKGLDVSEAVSLDRASRTLHLRSFASVDPGNGMLFLNIHPATALIDGAQAIALRNRVRYFGLTPQRVCLEILESECGDEKALVDAVSAFREVGFTLAIDDFGAERSNFDRVAALAPDLVKINRAMLADSVGQTRARRKLPLAISLVHEAGSRVVVEGIESAPDALLAMEAGADYMQGFFFSRPGPGLHDDAFTARMLAELGRVQAAPQSQAGAPVAAQLRKVG